MIAPLSFTPALSSVEQPEPMYFGRDDQRLFGWYHEARGAERRDVAVVLCAPVGSEYEPTGTPRAFRHWARQLADAGVATLRFDYAGTGDSSGDAGDVALQDWIENVGDAIEHVRRRSGASHVVVAGARFGATLALAAAKRRGDVDAAILWAPFPTGKAFLREGRAFARLGGKQDERGTVGQEDRAEQCAGLSLSGTMVEALTAFDPLGAGHAAPRRVLCIPKYDQVDSAFVARLTTAGAIVETATAPGYDAMIADAHAAAIPHELIVTTTRWIVDRYGRADRGSFVAGPSPALSAAPTVSETPLRFGSLFGVLSHPTGAARRSTGVLLVNAGSVDHVGPNRMYVTLSRRWAALGYSVLRFDIGGIGDSAAPAGAAENHPYPSHAVGDIARGIAELRARGADRIVLAGLCSGAHASFHAALELAGVHGVLLMNPIVFYWKPSDSLDFSSWLNYTESRHYASSARRWTTWVRLLRGQVEVRRASRIGYLRARDAVRAKHAALARRLRLRADEPENPARDFERLVGQGTDVLLLFSDGEPGHHHLRLHYGREVSRLQRASAFQLCAVDGADHTFTSPDARQRVEMLLTEHLVARHG